MQTLYFEEAWDKTIAPIDRKKITAHFTTIQKYNQRTLSFIREAINYKDETLVTVLIHNPELTPLHIQETPISYISLTGTTSTNIFRVPIPIPAKSSMPWTFIFSSANNTDQKPQFKITLPPS